MPTTARPQLALDFDTLSDFMPMHMMLDNDWRVRKIGPTLIKLGLGQGHLDRYLLDIFDVSQPRKLIQSEAALKAVGGKFKGYFKDLSHSKMTAFAKVLDDNQGILIGFSLGAGMLKAVEESSLLASDFSPADASLDLLYLVEVQQALLAEARRATFKMHVDRRSAMTKADTDVLTGLSNRRGLETFVQRILARKTFVPFGLIMIDLDYFKTVNDTYGHAAGDAVLREVAKRLSRLTRREDLVARSGGDEFHIILPNFTDASAAESLSNRIIAELQKKIMVEDITCEIGASIGMTIVSEHLEFPKVEQSVDRALYKSKQSGRGLVTIV